METWEIIGLVVLGVCGLVMLISEIGIRTAWSKIKVGDAAYLTQSGDGWKTIYGTVKVISRSDDVITVKLENGTHMDISKYDFTKGFKHFEWIIFNGLNVNE